MQADTTTIKVVLVEKSLVRVPCQAPFKLVNRKCRYVW
ncbi:hypothetical protein TcasGA2_TC034669 [Tribolium castaneum]|uniref:Uncharacterized protein n=1 Tax=Tribolium castaneum TaxID=7070 RepID=A0A139WJR0_TRICA|nr:hypothetical protein TcasGA2_TC034669 [Tribolium castaneum]